MKTIVSVNEISEFEIKPRRELTAWKEQVATEIGERWSDKSRWVTVSCPVCETDDRQHAFGKTGFSYSECARCKTLYAHQRPEAAELDWWYKQSVSVSLWKEKLLRSTETSRLEKIIEPRAYWILDGISEYISRQGASELVYTDVSFFGRALVRKIAEDSTGLKIISSGITDAAAYAGTGIESKPIASLADISLPAPTDILVAIDVLERVFSIADFFSKMESSVNPGGLVFATCPVASGFEIQTLWEQSPSVIPPDKLNLPTVSGLLELFAASGSWKVLELSTPGMFDVETVKQTIDALPDKAWPRTLLALVKHIDNQGAQLFTEYLQSQRLSSFARIVLRRV
ncbi:MAG: hypothetical protein JO301_15175 [Chitinophagaceae bacterium]|nr:hypothetical protein [Chitinophagaceae bacterium]